MKIIAKYSDILLAGGVIGILIVMIMPVPTVVMDLLLALNIAVALMILLVSMYITKPLQLSVFPGFLLIVTLFRLSLNVASTRLILGDAYAGKVISAFGNFVVRGNYVVGFIIFLILILINFVVITKGAGRVAEVAARFTLDSMPGKQMSIDADLNAGIIDETEARQRREETAREADFYGAMDGASKFVRGDAIAGLVITILNIVGGFIVGMAQMGLSFSQALQTYTQLTVGDGLVSQIPALIISTAAGMVVTRAASNSNLGSDLVKQILFNPRVAFIAAGVLFMLGMAPGMPFVTFTVLSAGVGAIGFALKAEPDEEDEQMTTPEIEQSVQEEIESYLRIDPVELEIGYNLIPLVDAEQGGDMLERITQIRRQLALDIGTVIPPIHIRDNIQLKPAEYIIKIRGNEVSRYEIILGHSLALNPGTATGSLEGKKIVEPAFGLPAVWVKGTQREKAEAMGFTLVAPPAVIATHLSEVLQKHADMILTRQDVQNLIDTFKKEQPALVEELVPNVLSLGTIERVLKNLLSERIPIRDLSTILETLSDNAAMTKDPDLLTEYVRQSLSRTIAGRYQDMEGKINALTLDPELEQVLTSAVSEARKNGVANISGLGFVLPTPTLQSLLTGLSREIEKVSQSGNQPILITSPTIRLYLRKLVEPVFKDLVILSFAEIPADLQIQSLGNVRLNNEG